MGEFFSLVLLPLLKIIMLNFDFLYKVFSAYNKYFY
jgi:hypothetical protein